MGKAEDPFDLSYFKLQIHSFIHSFIRFYCWVNQSLLDASCMPGPVIGGTQIQKRFHPTLKELLRGPASVLSGWGNGAWHCVYRSIRHVREYSCVLVAALDTGGWWAAEKVGVARSSDIHQVLTFPRPSGTIILPGRRWHRLRCPACIAQQRWPLLPCHP